MPDVMHVLWPGWVMIGEPLIFGTPGRQPAFGFPGLTAPGMPGCVTDGAVPELGNPDPDPVVPEMPGVAGAMPGAGAPPGCVGAVPVPVGEPPVCACAEAARSAANPTARTPLDSPAMISSPWILLCFPTDGA